MPCQTSLCLLCAAVLLSYAAPALAQCSKDTDCKGDRVCNEAGRCVAPTAPYRATPGSFQPQYQAAPPPYPPPGGPQSAYGYPPTQPQGDPQYRPPLTPYQPGPMQYAPVAPAQPAPPGYGYQQPTGFLGRGIPLTFTLTGDVDAPDHFEANVIDSASVTSVQKCVGRRNQPCRISVPPGTQARLQINIFNDDGSPTEITKEITITEAPQSWAVDVVSHRGTRVAANVIFGVGCGLALTGLGWALLDAAGGDNSFDAVGVPLLFGLGAELGGLVIAAAVKKSDEDSLLPDTTTSSSSLGDRGETPSRRGSAVRLTSFGLVPLGGGGAAALAFAF